MSAAPERVSYPLDYIDTGGLAITSRERGCSGTPTWQLIVRGKLEPDHVRTAFADVVTRYPMLKTKVHALNGKPPWSTRYRYAENPSFKADDTFRVIDLRGNPVAIDDLARTERSRHLDPFSDFPVTLTMATTGEDECHLFFRQHHAIADGRAFIGLLADFRDFLNAARSGHRPAPESLTPVSRKSEVEALGLTGWRLFVETLAGFLILFRIHLKALLKPLALLLQNQGNDYTGDNATVHWTVPEAMLDSWKGARARIGVSLNSMLTGAMFMAVRRWHRELKLPLGRTSSLVLLETRPRDRPFASFANHLAFPEVELALDQTADADAAMLAIQSQMQRDRNSRTSIRRLLAERWLIRFVPLAILRQIALHPARPLQNMSFSNLLSLPFPEIGGPSWRVEQVLITTPVQPLTGISLTAIRYGGSLVFNFNYKSSVVTREQTATFARYFETVISEWAGKQKASVRES